MSIAALKARTRAQYPFVLAYRLRWSDNDQYGHVNNSVYNFLIDSVVNTYLIAHCGLRPTSHTPVPADAPAAAAAAAAAADGNEPIGLVVSSHCNYFSSLSFPEVVDLGLRVAKLGNSSVTYEVGFFSQTGASEGQTPAAVGGFTHVFVHPESRRPTPMTAVMREGLRKIAGEGAKL